MKPTPVLAGVCGTDPFLLREPFLRELKAMGFAGIQNFPDRRPVRRHVSRNLEETGMGYRAGGRADRGRAQTRPADDAVCLQSGGGGVDGRSRGRHHRRPHGPDDYRHDRRKTAHDARPMRAGGSSRSPKLPRHCASDCLVLCHGGPIASPADAQYILDRSPVDGFYGASSMERLPVETAITAQVEQFVQLKLNSH